MGGRKIQELFGLFQLVFVERVSVVCSELFVSASSVCFCLRTKETEDLASLVQFFSVVSCEEFLQS